MSDQLSMLLHHGYLVFFLAIYLEGMGLPIPAVPWMLAAGALAGGGKLGFATLFFLGVFAGTLGDLFWFELGRRKGGKILNILCRISLEPDSCVGGTKKIFESHGSRGLVLSKFIPGLGLIMPPLTGIFGVGVGEFLLLDILGSALYVGIYEVLGYAFSDQLLRAYGAAGRLGLTLLILIAAGLALYVACKWLQRRMFLKKLSMARITADELRAMQLAGQPVLVLDVRSAVDLRATPHLVSGARWISKDEFEKRHGEVPRDRDIVVYCSCPNEASAAMIALLLHKHGINRVRPLLGGLEAWMEKTFPTDPVVDITDVAVGRWPGS